MNLLLRLTKYEFLNIARSRWVFFYCAFLLFLSVTFIYLAGDTAKALVTMSNVIVVLIPLTCILFTSFYWYSADRLTELLITQPIGRTTVLMARFVAMSASLGLGFFVGVVVPFIARGEFGSSLNLSMLTGGFLAISFCGLGTLIGVSIADRMRGVGLALAIWFYFVLVHDSAVLVLLILGKDYPMEISGGFLASVNPVGLTRVILLVNQDASMLLGHSGALARELLTTSKGIAIACVIGSLWLIAPLLLSVRLFKRRDL